MICPETVTSLTCSDSLSMTSTCKLQGTVCTPTSFERLSPKICRFLCCSVVCSHAENSVLVLKVCVRRKPFSSQPWEHFGRSVLNLLKAVNPFGRNGFHLCFIWIPAHHLWLTNKNEIAFGRGLAGTLIIQHVWPELV